MITTIVLAVVAVILLVFGIFSFLGKNSAEDDKDKAQKELVSTKKQLNNTQGELGTQKGAGQVLGRLVNTGESSADALKACTDSGFTLREQIVNTLNALQAGTNVDALVDALNTAINQNDSQCNNASSAYQDFKDAVNQIRNR
ncbi:MAG TPA: hypothetical protein VKH17_00360 [Acidimicrobiia bacterium]|nr:hypothetical protein [Acidimicrobiia bacterium]